MNSVQLEAREEEGRNELGGCGRGPGGECIARAVTGKNKIQYWIIGSSTQD